MRLALVPLNPTVGDLAGNARLIGDAIGAALPAADLIAFPELAVCGYPPRDLLLDAGFVDACERAADLAGSRTGPHQTAIIGCPRRRPDGRTANSLLVYHDGRRIEAYDKRLLPDYDVFDEPRYFTPGDRPAIVDIAGVRTGLAVCEDLWLGDDARESGRYGPADPLADLAAAGAELVVCPSASPFARGKDHAHRELLRRRAAAHGLVIASVNQHGANDDLIFDGHARIVGPDGVHAATPLFSGLPLVANLRERSPTPPDLADTAELHHALVLGIRDYASKSGFPGVCLGLSGGIDSALTATLAVAALGPDAVLGVAMPSAVSSDHSREDAADLARRLGIRLVTLPIEPARAAFAGPIDGAFDALAAPRLGSARPDLADENLQSRIRGTAIMAISNRTGRLVLTTGNKSEYAVGYATLYGDMNGALAVLIDVPKGRVYELARWINANAPALGLAPADGAPGGPIPQRSIDKPPSAELAPGQLDRDSLPPYPLLDLIIERRVDDRLAEDHVVAALDGAAADGTTLDEAEIRRVCRLIDRSEYKRFQAAVGLRTTGRAFGPGRRMPVVARRTPPAG